MVTECFVLHKDVIDIFHAKFYIPTIEKLSFRLFCVRVLGSMEFGKTRNDFFHDNAFKNRVKVRLCRKIQQNNRYRNTESKFGWK